MLERRGDGSPAQAPPTAVDRRQQCDGLGVGQVVVGCEQTGDTGKLGCDKTDRCRFRFSWSKNIGIPPPPKTVSIVHDSRTLQAQDSRASRWKARPISSSPPVDTLVF